MKARTSVRTVGGAILALLLGLLFTATSAQAATTATDLGKGYSINLATGVVTAPGDDRVLYVQVYDAATDHQTRVALATLASGSTAARLSPDRWAALGQCQIDVSTEKQANVHYPNGPGSRGFITGRIIAACGHPLTVLTKPTVNVTPGTCATPGTLTYAAGEHYTVTGDKSGTTGPGNYTVTVTAKRGFTFADEKTVVLTGAIEGKKTGLVCAGPQPVPKVTTRTDVATSCTARTTTTTVWATTTRYVLVGGVWTLGAPVEVKTSVTSAPASATVCPLVVAAPAKPAVSGAQPVAAPAPTVAAAPVAAMTELPLTGGEDVPVRALLVWVLGLIAAGALLTIGSRRLT